MVPIANTSPATQKPSVRRLALLRTGGEAVGVSAEEAREDGPGIGLPIGVILVPVWGESVIT
jgi:hypothetical protein